MDTADWPEWCVRQPAPADRAACVWVHAPTAVAAAALRRGPPWTTGRMAHGARR